MIITGAGLLAAAPFAGWVVHFFPVKNTTTIAVSLAFVIVASISLAVAWKGRSSIVRISRRTISGEARRVSLDWSEVAAVDPLDKSGGIAVYRMAANKSLAESKISILIDTTMVSIRHGPRVQKIMLRLMRRHHPTNSPQPADTDIA